MSTQLLVSLILGLGVVYGFLNGAQDSGSLTAGMICSGAIGPRRALALTAISQFAGALLVGVAVAHTIGQGLVDPRALSPSVALAAIAGASAWNLLTWCFELPSSTSHALIGALVGAVWFHSGPGAIYLRGLAGVLLVLLLSPGIGFVTSYLVTKVLFVLLQGATPRIGSRLRQMQWLLAPFLAAGHGANDAQKAMGIVAIGLVGLRVLTAFAIPPWLQVMAALSLALGTSLGGLRIMRTLGLRLYRIRPIHALAAQASSALVVLTASVLGGPVSTSQVMGASIAGAGSAQRINQVRWGVISNIVTAWLLTVPAAGVLGALFAWAGGHFF